MTSKRLSSFVAVCAGALAVVPAVLFLSGCRAGPAPDSGFLQHPEQLAPDKTLPFDAVWLKPQVDLRSYNKVYVAPIDTTHLLALDWWDKANFAPGDEKKQADSLAEDFRTKLVEAFKKDERKRFEVVDKPDKGVLSVELAIVEVVPTKVWLNTIAYALIGGVSQGTTAFEGRLRDGTTQEVLARFKDQEFGQMSLVNISDLTWFRHSEHTMKIWSEDLVKMCAREPGEAISPMATVTLRPW